MFAAGKRGESPVAVADLYMRWTARAYALPTSLFRLRHLMKELNDSVAAGGPLDANEKKGNTFALWIVRPPE